MSEAANQYGFDRMSYLKRLGSVGAKNHVKA